MTQSGRQQVTIRLSLKSLISTNLELGSKRTNDKAKPAERLGRKATGPRFLREATEGLPKDPKIAGLPISPRRSMGN